MKKTSMKTFGLYAIAWLAVLGLFNVIAFVTPNEIDGISKFDSSFWVAYSLITVTFIGQLACSFLVFRGESWKKSFYHLSLYKISVTSLAIMMIVGCLSIGIVTMPNWIGIIVCCLVLTLYIVAVVKALMAIAPVEEIDKKIKVKTMFVKMLIADAETLVAKAEGDEMNAIVHQVYDAIRYSDPMSDDALAIVENKITETFSVLSGAVEGKNQEEAEAAAKQLMILLTERNAKCKILK